MRKSVAAAVPSIGKVMSQLPVDLCKNILCSFFTLAEIVHLDSAVLNHKLRGQLQERYCDIVLRCPEAISLSYSAALWLSAKRVYVLRLTVTSWSGSNHLPSNIARNLEGLQFARQSKLTPMSLQSILCGNSANLHTLGFRECVCEEQSFLLGVGDLCPQLREIDLGLTSTSAVGIASLLVSCKQLVTIRLSDCAAIDDTAVSTIAKACPSLQRLHAENCSTCTDLAVLSLAEHCPGLAHLNIMGWDKITDHSLARLAEKCADLRGIHLMDSDKITAQTVRSLATHCRKLEEVTLLHCDRISSDAMVTLVRTCSELRVLSCHGNDAVLTCLAANCPRLTTLMTYHPESVSGEALYRLLSGCVELHSLCVSHFSCLASSLQPLRCAVKVLDLSRCPDKTDAQVESLVRHLPLLEEVYLQDCAQLSDAALIAVAEHCPALRVVDASGLHGLTDVSAVVLSVLCPQLRQASFYDCEKLTDKAVVSIAQHCALLTHLNLSVCERAETLYIRAYW